MDGYDENEFCDPECQWLSPTESEQSTQTIKAPHKCGKYNEFVFHMRCHPNIVKCTKCFIEGK